MLATMLGVAVLHDRVMLTVLRKYWVNFDLVWAAALIVAGALLLAGAAGHAHASH
jgi:hypothetical protein